MKTSTEFGITIKDTEFLLRLIMGTHIQGADLEQATETLHKLKRIQQELMEKVYNG